MEGEAFLVKWQGGLKTENCILKGISNFLRPFALFSTVTVASYITAENRSFNVYLFYR